MHVGRIIINYVENTKSCEISLQRGLRIQLGMGRYEFSNQMHKHLQIQSTSLWQWIIRGNHKGANPKADMEKVEDYQIKKTLYWSSKISVKRIVHKFCYCSNPVHANFISILYQLILNPIHANFNSVIYHLSINSKSYSCRL